MPKLPGGNKHFSTPISPYKQHVRDWLGCTKCELCLGRNKVVLATGQIPCDILFVGEAPGESEDSIGSPFVGPAGHLLHHIIDKSGIRSDWRVALTNLVCCIPRNEEEGGKLAQPPVESILACGERLREFVRIAKPRLIVCVGELPKTWLMAPKGKVKQSVLDGVYGGKYIHILHPSGILQGNVAQRNISVRKCTITLANAGALMKKGKSVNPQVNQTPVSVAKGEGK